MTARDDYPEAAAIAAEVECVDRAPVPEAVGMLYEIERLRDEVARLMAFDIINRDTVWALGYIADLTARAEKAEGERDHYKRLFKQLTGEVDDLLAARGKYGAAGDGAA